MFYISSMQRGPDQIWQSKEVKPEVLQLKSFFLIDMDVSDVNFELICYMEMYLEKLLPDRIIAGFSYMCQNQTSI